MSYNNNPEHKRLIDEVLKENAELFQQLGKSNSKKEYEEAKAKEEENLKRVYKLDPLFISFLIKHRT
jgi:ElaB/YqjD/DUF883 family membrane-anchored ribosome-binding protein